MKLVMMLFVMTGLIVPAVSFAATPSEKGAKVYFITPANGAKLKSPFTVKFGLSGMGVAPAGTEKANTGHHHLLVDVSKIDTQMAIAKDKQHLHFGGGQTETQVSLPKGKHTLQMILGDHNHIPHNPPVMSKKITIWVR